MRHHPPSPATPGGIRSRIRRATFAASSRWRSLLGRIAGVRFIGVTGSAGKTTTTKLIAACLRVAGRVRDTERMVGQLNGQRFAAQRVLTTTPFHRFCVSEFGIGGPGLMASCVEAMPPDIGVVTIVNAGGPRVVGRSSVPTAPSAGNRNTPDAIIIGQGGIASSRVRELGVFQHEDAVSRGGGGSPILTPRRGLPAWDPVWPWACWLRIG